MEPAEPHPLRRPGGRRPHLRCACRAATNRLCDELYTDPSTVAPTCYDSVTNPGARAWFKGTAHELIAITAGYLALLDRYGIPWMELRTTSPRRVTYEDDVQVVAVPHTFAEDWPLSRAEATSADNPEQPWSSAFVAVAEVRRYRPKDDLSHRF